MDSANMTGTFPPNFEVRLTENPDADLNAIGGRIVVSSGCQAHVDERWVQEDHLIITVMPDRVEKFRAYARERGIHLFER